MSEESLRGNRYFNLLIDDHSKWSWVFFTKNKSEAFGKFQDFHAIVERQTGMKLKTLRSDQGGEFYSLEFQKYSDRLGIKKVHSTLLTTVKWGGGT